MEEKDKKKICIVDDEENILEIYKTELLQEGYDVLTAADGEEGFQVIQKEKPDLVLVDIMMPKVDGLELMRKIRGDATLHKTPIIVMSNVEDREVVKNAGDLEVQFYLTKSLFEPKKVAGIVAEVLEHK